MKEKKQISFFRNYRNFTGGHLKVWHYFHHVRSSAGYNPEIFFGSRTIFNTDNPWSGEESLMTDSWDPGKSDVLFLGGMNWEFIPEPQRNQYPKPVINLIQGVRHAVPDTELFSFLSAKAIRICVSREVAYAILATGKVNGPVFIIPAGIENFEEIRNRDHRTKQYDLLIAGLKNPGLALSIQQSETVSRLKTCCLTEFIPREQFLELICSSTTTVFLPARHEGFYLPALEGMAGATLVICPDCVGNRSFCIPDQTCFVPEYQAEGIIAAIERSLTLTVAQRSEITTRAGSMAERYTLGQERSLFLQILDQLDQLWSERSLYNQI